MEQTERALILCYAVHTRQYLRSQLFDYKDDIILGDINAMDRHRGTLPSVIILYHIPIDKLTSRMLEHIEMMQHISGCDRFWTSHISFVKELLDDLKRGKDD